MVFENGVEIIQAAAYNGARTVVTVAAELGLKEVQLYPQILPCIKVKPVPLKDLQCRWNI